MYRNTKNAGVLFQTPNSEMLMVTVKGHLAGTIYHPNFRQVAPELWMIASSRGKLKNFTAHFWERQIYVPQILVPIISIKRKFRSEPTF